MASIEIEVNRNVYNEGSNISNSEGRISRIESEIITNTDREIENANEEVGSSEIPVESEITSKNKHETENENENSIISNNGCSINQIKSEIVSNTDNEIEDTIEEVGLCEIPVESKIISKNKHESENLENLASVCGEYIAHDSILKERLV